ncbi:MAG: hypothetical protein ACP5D2_03585 [Candidatus Nanoarchaeia archaeon]
MFVKEVKPKIIKNSRGERTIEVLLETFRGKFKSSAPSGKSTGKYEVQPYSSKGIRGSLRLMKMLAKILKHKNFMIKTFHDLDKLGDVIDRFENKYGKIGGNCRYVLEAVFLKGAAKERKKQVWEMINDVFNDGKKPKMPMPVGNCIGGGMHSTGRKPDFQEFLLIPNEKKFSRAVTKNVHAYERAKKLLKKKQKSWKVKTNDENALMTSLNNEDVLDILHELKKQYGVRIGLDVAASSFFKRGYYHYENKRLIRDRQEQIDYIATLIDKYGLFYVEDPLQEEDYSGFLNLEKEVDKKRLLIVGDDLTVTDVKKVRHASKTGVNAVIVKPNQIGSLLEVAKVVQECKKHNLAMVFSHRSGETMDDFLADLCVGFSGDFIKTGIMGRERLIKLRRVMEIERSLN